MNVVLTMPWVPPAQRTIITLPMGLLYLGSYLRRSLPQVGVRLLDPALSTASREAFLAEVAAARPEVLGVSLWSHTLSEGRRFIAALGQALPQTVILVGGSHVNAVREAVLAQVPDADYALYGEGELGLAAFVRQWLEHGRIVAPAAIPGLIHRQTDGGVVVEPNTFTDDLDLFDPLDYGLVDLETYFRMGSPMGLFRRGSRVAQVITTRGCPFLCTFCASPLNMGQRVRRRSSGNILREIQELASHGADEIHIMDDNFTFHRQHVIDLCQGIVAANLGIHVAMPNGIRLDRLDRDMVAWMKRAGWQQIGFGVEVGSDEALKKIHKGITMAKIREKLALVKEAGILTTGFFILGFPHDTLESMRQTRRVPDQLGLDMASFGNFTPLPGTVLYQELVASGQIPPDYEPSFASGQVTYAPPGISAARLAREQRNAVLFFWLHPRRLRLILSLLQWRDVRFVARRLLNLLFRPAKA